MALTWGRHGIGDCLLDDPRQLIPRRIIDSPNQGCWDHPVKKAILALAPEWVEGGRPSNRTWGECPGHVPGLRARLVSVR